MPHLIKRIVFAILLSTTPLCGVPILALQHEAEQKTETVIAVADFTGNDKELGRFLSETLLTQLAQSEKLALVERTEIRQALTELKLQSTGLFEPQQVKKIGKMLSADCVVVGSYLVRENQLIVNARLLDVKTGRLTPGGAASVAGSRDDILTITGKLARLFHKRVTGVELGAKVENDAPSRRSSPRETASTNVSPDLSDRFSQWKQEGLLPQNARPGTVITERDFSKLIEGLKQRLPIGSEAPLTLMQPGAAVSRLRAVTALLKLTYPSTRLAEFRNPSTGDLPTDAGEAPAWGLPYLALATAQGWWDQNSPFKARNVANWAFVSALMEHLPLEERRATNSEVRVANEENTDNSDTYTGLVIEAAGLNPQRSMSPRILDEDGLVVYPDPKHLPDDDMLQDIGMASYYRAGQSISRAGSRPLVVTAIDCTGPLKCDLVVSRQTADEIRRANRSGRFLWKWAIGIITESSR